MIAVGLLGYGYWGPNLLRCLSATPNVRVDVVADRDIDRLAVVAATLPAIEMTTSARDVIDHPAIDAVVIATPVATHFDLAMAALQAGKHVLVEKPLTTSSDEAQRLIEVATRRRLSLMVDHTFIYSGAVRMLREMVAGADLGRVRFYEAMRTSLACFQPEVGVLWDLAVHDLTILDHLLRDDPLQIAANTSSHRPRAVPDLASMTLQFEDGALAHIHANCRSGVKVRRTLVGGTRATVVYDDVEPSEKLRVYECAPEAAEVASLRTAHRAGRIWTPALSVAEPLRAMAAHFAASIESGARPDSDGASALRVIRWLEAATQSTASGGRPIAVQSTAWQ